MAANPDDRRMMALCLVVSILLAAGCQGPRLMPTPNLYVIEGDDVFRDVPAAYRNCRVDVIYATDRAAGNGDHRDDDIHHYGSRRSTSLAVGVATLQIGRGITWDDLVRQSTTTRDDLLPLAITEVDEKFRLPDTPLLFAEESDIVKDSPESAAAMAKSETDLHSLIQTHLAHTECKDAYVYIHGYNNCFNDAIYVIGQLWHFLGRRGVPIAYTWPAGRGGIRGYTYDRESGEFTIFHLKQFLQMLARSPEIERIHLIAHSRGTDVIITALRELHMYYRGRGQSTREQLKLGNLILAAPDIDLEVVMQRAYAERLQFVPERLTVYISEYDKAIGLAEWLFDSIVRIGRLTIELLTPLQKKHLAGLPRLNMIDAEVDSGLIGHGYFYSHPAVSSDLILILRDNRDAGKEHGRPMLELAPNYWQIRNNYPEGETDRQAKP